MLLNSFIPFHLCSFPKSHELVAEEAIYIYTHIYIYMYMYMYICIYTVMKNKVSMCVGKVLEGKWTRTQCVLHNTASNVVSLPLTPHVYQNPHQK